MTFFLLDEDCIFAVLMVSYTILSVHDIELKQEMV